MPSLRAAVLLTLLASLAAAGVACALVVGLEEPRARALPPPANPGEDPCSHITVPAPPAAEDDGASVAPFWLALRRSYIGQTVTQPDAALPGLDLDGVCTCNRDPRTAHDGGSSCNPRGGAPIFCDEDGGIDNSIAKVFAATATLFDPDRFNGHIERGETTLLMYIADYNGKANDLAVSVGFAVSDGIFSTSCDPTLIVNANAPGAGPDGLGYYLPSWRGCDQWHGKPDQFVGTPTVPESYIPKGVGRAYVRDHVLVLSGAADVPVFLGDLVASIQDPSLVAPLVQVPNASPNSPIRFRMDGAILAGRLPLRDLASVTFNTSFNGFHPCQDMATFQGLMSTACQGVDLTDSHTLDFQNQPCTSLSFALRFDADLVDLDRADRQPKPAAPNPCQSIPLPSIDTLCPP